MKKSFTVLLTMLCIVCTSMKVLAFDTEIKGRVTDASGAPLPGVTVTVKGTSKGTLTDPNGNYSLVVAESNDILVFRQVGYVTVERTVGSQTVINVSLEEDVQALEEVVVVGYGTVRKSDVTGAIAK